MEAKKRDKFKSLAENRTNSAIKQIRLIGNLSNKSSYSYEEKDVLKIYNALSSEIKAMKERFSNDVGSGRPTFKL